MPRKAPAATVYCLLMVQRETWGDGWRGGLLTLRESFGRTKRRAAAGLISLSRPDHHIGLVALETPLESAILDGRGIGGGIVNRTLGRRGR